MNRAERRLRKRGRYSLIDEIQDYGVGAVEERLDGLPDSPEARAERDLFLDLTLKYDFRRDGFQRLRADLAREDLARGRSARKGRRPSA